MSSIPTYPEYRITSEPCGQTKMYTVLVTNIRKKFRGVWYLINVSRSAIHNPASLDEAYRHFMCDVHMAMVFSKKEKCLTFTGVPMFKKDECQLDEAERLIKLL
jgi:hypothetical protein